MIILRKLLSAAVFCGLFVGVNSATAVAAIPAPTFAASGASVASGGTGIAEFSVSFAPAYSLADLTLNIDYDFSKLSFDRAASTVSVGAAPAVSLGIFESTASLSANNNPAAGQYTLVGTFDTPLTASPLVFKTAFKLINGATSADVRFFGAVTSETGFLPDDFDKTVSISIAAVPEPENWALLLAGLGVIGATVRRRAAVNA